MSASAYRAGNAACAEVARFERNIDDGSAPEVNGTRLRLDPEVKPQSLNLSKTPVYSGVLKGIKGQYLIFEDNTVFNVRSNEGLVVGLDVS